MSLMDRQLVLGISINFIGVYFHTYSVKRN